MTKNSLLNPLLENAPKYTLVLDQWQTKLLNIAFLSIIFYTKNSIDE